MIHDITPVNTYTGNNLSVHFDFDFYVENENQLKVTHFDSEGKSTILVNDVDYIINELKNPNGSYITFPVQGSLFNILSDEEKISLELTLPISQETQYNNSSLLNLEALEYSLDYLTRICQIMNRKISRAVKVAEDSIIDTSPLIQNINTVSEISNKIAIVANSISSINSVVEDLENINLTANDLENIDNAQNYSILSKQYAIGIPQEPIEGSAKYWAQQASSGQMQADWSESDSTSRSYIKNKPDLTTKQDTLISGTNIKTINNNSILGSGNLVLDGLPVQTGQSGKFLTTNGTSASWAEVQAGDSLPDQTGHNGDLLTTDGTDASWVGTEEIYPIIETYSNGTSWYRVYSDGWCEQGGTVDTSKSTSTFTINFLKPFTTTNYKFFQSQYSVSDDYVQRISSKTTTSIVIAGQNDSTQFDWQASGYIEV